MIMSTLNRTLPPAPPHPEHTSEADQLAHRAGEQLASDPSAARGLAKAALALEPAHAVARHHLGEAVARMGKVDRALGLLREAVSLDARLSDLGGDLPQPAGPQEPAAWIGRYATDACPVCESTGGRRVWAGNITRAIVGHGRLDPVRAWIRCDDCGLLRVEAPVPEVALEAWQDAATSCTPPPPRPAVAGARIGNWETVIQRIREAGHGDAWMTRDQEARYPRPRLLDIGPGHGEAAAAAAWRGFQVDAVLEEAGPAAWAEAHLDLATKVGSDPEALPDGPYDVVLARMDLCTSTDPVEHLAMLGDRLAPDGLLALRIQFSDHPMARLQGYDAPNWSAPAARCWFDRETLAVAMLRANLCPETSFAAPDEPGVEIVLARREV